MRISVFPYRSFVSTRENSDDEVHHEQEDEDGEGKRQEGACKNTFQKKTQQKLYLEKPNKTHIPKNKPKKKPGKGREKNTKSREM